MDEATRRRLHALRSECGCGAGAVAALVAVGTYIIHANWLSPVTRSYGERIITGICIGLAGMLIGKMAGVLWARHRYQRLLREMGQAPTPRNAIWSWRPARTAGAAPVMPAAGWRKRTLGKV